MTRTPARVADARRLVRSLTGLGGDPATTLLLGRRLPAERWPQIALLAEVDAPDADTVALVVDMLGDIAHAEAVYQRRTCGNFPWTPGRR